MFCRRAIRYLPYCFASPIGLGAAIRLKFTIYLQPSCTACRLALISRRAADQQNTARGPVTRERCVYLPTMAVWPIVPGAAMSNLPDKLILNCDVMLHLALAVPMTVRTMPLLRTVREPNTMRLPESF